MKYGEQIYREGTWRAGAVGNRMVGKRGAGVISGMSGVEAAATFRREYATTPVIVLTGFPDDALAVGFIKKKWLGSSLNLDSSVYVSARRETKANHSILIISRSRSETRLDFRTDFRLCDLIPAHFKTS